MSGHLVEEGMPLKKRRFVSTALSGQSKRLGPHGFARFALVLAMALFAASCGGSGDDADTVADSDTLTVVATTSILGDLVSQVTVGEAIVEVLVPLGVDPHEYQLTSRQIALIEQADLVVANGLSLEVGMLDVLSAAAADGVNLVAIADQLDPRVFPDGTGDPHFWLDPVRVAEAAGLIAAELAAIDDTIDWMGKSAGYQSVLVELDESIRAAVASVAPERRVLVTNHDALGYYADRYGFTVIGTVIPGGTTLGDPSSSDLSRLVDLIDENGVSAIFAETTEANDLVDALAAEAGFEVRVIELFTGSLGPTDSGASTIVGLLEVNTERIVDGLR